MAFLAECVSEMPTKELYAYTGKLTINRDNIALSAN